MTEQGQPTPQRIGDAERDRAAELLREHMAQGRLTPEEFDERVDRALRARTAGDLDPLFTDLPGPRPGQTVATTPVPGTPPWPSAVAAPVPAAPTPLPARSGPASALAGLTGVLWVVVSLAITFVPGLGWANFWWLVFIPVVFSMVVGKSESDRERERRRIAREQDRLDRRRRAIGD